MSLVPIPDQPIDVTANPEHPDCVDCSMQVENCVEFGLNDRLYFQMRNEGESLGYNISACVGMPTLFDAIFCINTSDLLVDDPSFNDPTQWGIQDITPPGDQTHSFISPGIMLMEGAALTNDEWRLQPYVGGSAVTIPNGDYSFEWTLTTGSWTGVNTSIYLLIGGVPTQFLLVDSPTLTSGQTYSGIVSLPGWTSSSNYQLRVFSFSPPSMGGQNIIESFNLRLSSTTISGSWNLADCGASPGAYISNPSGAENPLTLTTSSIFPSINTASYRYELNISSIVSGGVFLRIGTLTSPTFSSTGVHVWDVNVDSANAGNELEIVADAFFVGKVFGITGKQLGGGSSSGIGWVVDGSLCAWRHLTDPVSVAPLLLTSPMINEGSYKVTIRVDDVSDGTVSLARNGILFPAISRAGTYSYYIYQSGAPSYLTAVPSQDFDGTFAWVDIARQYNRHQFLLTDSSGEIVTNITSSANYDGDFVTVYADLLSEPLNCFNLAVVEEVATGLDLPQLVVDPLFIEDPYSNWTLTETTPTVVFGSTTSLAPGVLCDSGSGNLYQRLGIMREDTCYKVRIEIGACTNFFGQFQTVNLNGFEVYFGSYLAYSNPGPVGSATVFNFQFTLDATTIAAGATNEMQIFWSTSTFRIASVSATMCIEDATASDATYLSNCLVKNAAPACDSAYLTAGMDGAYYDAIQDKWINPVAYGFQFNTNFKLALRAPIYFLNENWDGNDSRYSYRNGREQRTAGSTQKTWEMIIAKQNTYAHDALAIMGKCEYFGVQYTPTSYYTEYVVTSDDYSPNWPKGERSKVADVSVDVVRRENSRRYQRRVF